MGEHSLYFRMTYLADCSADDQRMVTSADEQEIIARVNAPAKGEHEMVLDGGRAREVSPPFS